MFTRGRAILFEVKGFCLDRNETKTEYDSSGLRLIGLLFHVCAGGLCADTPLSHPSQTRAARKAHKWEPLDQIPRRQGKTQCT